MSDFEERKKWLRENQDFCNQYRSWRIMEDYFGISNPAESKVFIPLENILPPDDLKTLSDFGKQMRKEIEMRYVLNN